MTLRTHPSRSGAALLLAGVLIAGLSAAAGAQSPSAAPAASPAAPAASAAPAGACPYAKEWLDHWTFALQPDPHAAYTYAIPAVTPGVGLLITGQFPHAVWTSWTVYTDSGQPYSVVSNAKITPDEGSVNPFVVGTPVLSPNRDFTVLVVPDGTDTATLPAPLSAVAASNILTSPTSGSAYILANRVYNAFPGYDKGGAGGPTDIPFPTTQAVDLTTGQVIDCAPISKIGDRTGPTASGTGNGVITLEDGTTITVGSQGSRDGTADGAEYAPTLDPNLVEFTRPPLLPGSDVSQVPPVDSCAGYLGAAMSLDKIGLIRMPHVASWFDTKNITDQTLYEQNEADYVSFTQYGNVIGKYKPGHPASGSLADAELLPDKSGGSTIVVWPRSLSKADQKAVFKLARKNGWAIIRGGGSGNITTSNLFVRLKGADPSYTGGYSPTSDVQGVPCYFDNHQGDAWSSLTGDSFVASPANIGAGAPMGVNCSVKAYLDGSCLKKLKAYISNAGGSYEVVGG
ncbi:MAG: hypothetical protein U0869_07895 [Chloroflexota bacterium]